jgi:hypothetical protein
MVISGCAAVVVPGRWVVHERQSKRVVEKLLTYLLEIDTYRGAGRLYLP